MSVEIREAIDAIQKMKVNMNPEADFLAIYEAEEHMVAIEASRKKELDEAQTNLKALAKLLDAARTSSTRPKSIPTPAEHVAHVTALDKTRLSLMKAINDAESSLAGKEAELGQLKEEARRLEESDPAAEHESELDGTTLRLAIFKGMGFEPVVDKNGNPVKMLIRSQSGDVHCIPLDDGKLEYERANLLWNLASK
ncbi:hypothetical protein JAAARDRAFT_33002 [Jaapia argillacea MUCL 33604]|uniref:Kinetochore protein Spc24 n=1 Tax=Jaapia argillacea MUCL 33604 TaxID=933084 RepID=A0A067PXN6_9AGAM|nr:hypothetical protein JAAARDRAFT_33002 [Jaapia argillacea MUCL 33604]